MALFTRSRLISKENLIKNITKNLETLQFESALSDDEKKLLTLRPRSHAITVTYCALACYMVDIFNKTRNGQLALLNEDYNEASYMLPGSPEKHRKTKASDKEKDKESLRFGIIGSGRLGKQVALSLLSYGQLFPAQLHVSTRRPELLGDLHNKGVECYFDNRRLVSSVNVVIFCVLPSQMPFVAEEIKDSLTASHIVISHCSSLSARQLHQMLHTPNIIHPVLNWSDDNSYNVNYDYTISVSEALEKRETVESTCPIGVEKEGLVVSTDHRLAEIIILAVVNLCTGQELTQEQTLTIVQNVVFGGSLKKQLDCDRLTPENFGLGIHLSDKNKGYHFMHHSKVTTLVHFLGGSYFSITAHPMHKAGNLTIKLFTKETPSGVPMLLYGVIGFFPFYNLVDVFENGTPLLKVLQENDSMRKAFVSRYSQLFEDYILENKLGIM